MNEISVFVFNVKHVGFVFATNSKPCKKPSLSFGKLGCEILAITMLFGKIGCVNLTLEIDKIDQVMLAIDCWTFLSATKARLLDISLCICSQTRLWIIWK